jgi:CDP-diacylglycerol--inositol 3-phosphatidyltransferase
LFLGQFLDCIDGLLARKFNQCSDFGMVLDMVTDRASTAGFLANLNMIYPQYSFWFTFVLMLDIISHWMQMYR